MVLGAGIVFYQSHCQALLTRFGQSKSPALEERTAKACLLLPQPGVDLSQLSDLSAHALSLAGTNRVIQGDNIAWYKFAKGLAEFRLGHPQEAENLLTNITKTGNPYRDAPVNVVLSMTAFRQGQTEKARAAFDKGAEIAKAQLPNPESNALGPHWGDVLVPYILMREAKQIFEGGAAHVNKKD